MFFVTGNYDWSVSMLQHALAPIQWEPLQTRQNNI